MKKLIEKIKNYKINKYKKIVEKYEKMSEEELEIEYIDLKLNDRFLKILGAVLFLSVICCFQTIQSMIDVSNSAKLAYLINQEPLEIADKFKYGSPFPVALMGILIALLTISIIYNGLMNLKELIIIEKVRNKKS